jgi:hypothetical protein
MIKKAAQKGQPFFCLVQNSWCAAIALACSRRANLFVFFNPLYFCLKQYDFICFCLKEKKVYL